MKTTWQKLIKLKIKENKETQESIAEKLNVTQSSIAHWLSGRRKPDTDIISSLMKAVGINSFVLYKDGLASENDSKIEKKLHFTVDVLDIYASAGQGVINMDVIEVIRSIEYNNIEAQKLFGGKNQNNIKVINIKGDSMQGIFEPGDLAFVDITINHFDGDGIYVFIYDNCLFVKRLQRLRNKLLVISENKSYESWEIPKVEFDQIYIKGKILLSQSMHLRKHS